MFGPKMFYRKLIANYLGSTWLLPEFQLTTLVMLKYRLTIATETSKMPPYSPKELVRRERARQACARYYVR